MRIALFPSKKKPPAIELAAKIQEFLAARGVEVAAEIELCSELKATPIETLQNKKIDFLISIGGDGTILRLLHKYANLHAPILGINMGSLGFMADVPRDDILPSLEDLLKGSYSIEKRLILDIASGKESYFAANDFVIHRGCNHSLIEIGVYVNNFYLNTFVADGLIIATPNGSSAYSLAAGGPIISPNVEAFVITPICAHTISNRPLVIAADCEIKIQYLSNYDNPGSVHIDGTDHFAMNVDSVVTLKKSAKTFNWVNLYRRQYFATLRTKLGWSGKLTH